MLDKTRKLLIFGTGDFAQLAHFYFSEESEYEVVGFTADYKYVQESGGKFCGKPVFKFENIYDFILLAEKILAVWIANFLLNFLLSKAITADLFFFWDLFR